jgi:hypothetical protein
MPVFDTRNIIPFVNDLETKINGMTTAVDDWKKEKGRILLGLDTINSNKNRSTTALIKADEALSEIGTATFDVVAQRGRRLKTLIDNLKAEVYEIAQNAGGSGGVGFDPRINAEVDNAVSSVDAVVADGLKLDYRLHKITEVAMKGEALSEKDMVIPQIEVFNDLMVSNPVLTPAAGILFIEGDVTVLGEDGEPLLDADNDLITGSVDVNGQVNLSAAPGKTVKLIFPAEMDMKDIPKDFLYVFLQTVIQKNSNYMQDILNFQNLLRDVLTDIRAMKGENWTADYSIMRNHQELVKESITPKGLQVEVKDGMAHATFSYNDHPALSHFVVEKLDATTNQWVPYDGSNGVITK